MAIEAFVFDFDGIITDTEPVHMEAWQGVLEGQGIDFGEEEYRQHYIGLNDRDFLEAVCRVHNRHLDDNEKADLIERKSIASIDLLRKEVPLIPGVREFIEAVRGQQLLAICSGANRGEIDFILRHAKLTGIFDPIVASDSVKRGKPDPEGYIRALEGLQERKGGVVLAEQVVAIEDSPRGVAAAKAAGLRCLAVLTTFDRSELAAADWIVESLSDVEPGDLS